MKSLVLSLFIAIPSVAAADKLLIAENAEWDCADDPVVVINAGGGTFRFNGACQSIAIEGGDNQLTIASVKRLSIVGAANQADVDAVSSIKIVGSQNRVTWKGKKPAVKTVGIGNRVVRSPSKPAP